MNKMKELYDKVAADSVLQTKYAEIMKDIDTVSAETTEEKLMTFAKEEGFDVTLEDMRTFFTELAENSEGELSEAELDAVAGGKGNETRTSYGRPYCYPPVPSSMRMKTCDSNPFLA